MQKIQLLELVAKVGQATVAKAIGVSPAAIHKAINAHRNIIVTVHDDGSYTAEEVRPFPSHRTAA